MTKSSETCSSLQIFLLPSESMKLWCWSADQRRNALCPTNGAMFPLATCCCCHPHEQGPRRRDGRLITYRPGDAVVDDLCKERDSALEVSEISVCERASKLLGKAGQTLHQLGTFHYRAAGYQLPGTAPSPRRRPGSSPTGVTHQAY